MKGCIKQKEVDGRQLFVYTPPSYEEKNKTFPVLYSHDGQEVSKIAEKLLPKLESAFEQEKLQEFIWIGIYPEKRQDEYTPWPAPALVPQFEDFKGLGKGYIQFVSEQLKKYIDENYRTKPEAENTWMMGYSLGGLISVYAAYETAVFGKIASICGSFWYEGMTEWVKEHEILNKDIKLFMYYGKKEGKGKATRQCDAVKCAEEVIKSLEEKTCRSLIVNSDEGGHHQYIVERYEKTIFWLADVS